MFRVRVDRPRGSANAGGFLPIFQLRANGESARSADNDSTMRHCNERDARYHRIYMTETDRQRDRQTD